MQTEYLVIAFAVGISLIGVLPLVSGTVIEKFDSILSMFPGQSGI